MDGIPGDLERNGFRAPDGELAWTREAAAKLVPVLADQGLAILGGEVWFVREGQPFWTGLIPQRQGGRPAVYTWTAEREPGEDWAAFVRRSAALALDAVERMPGPDDLPEDLAGRILYNLSWVAEDELSRLEEGRASIGEAAAAGSGADAARGEPGTKRGFLSKLFGGH